MTPLKTLQFPQKSLTILEKDFQLFPKHFSQIFFDFDP